MLHPTYSTGLICVLTMVVFMNNGIEWFQLYHQSKPNTNWLANTPKERVDRGAQKCCRSTRVPSINVCVVRVHSRIDWNSSAFDKIKQFLSFSLFFFRTEEVNKTPSSTSSSSNSIINVSQPFCKPWVPGGGGGEHLTWLHTLNQPIKMGRLSLDPWPDWILGVYS